MFSPNNLNFIDGFLGHERLKFVLFLYVQDLIHNIVENFGISIPNPGMALLKPDNLVFNTVEGPVETKA